MRFFAACAVFVALGSATLPSGQAPTRRVTTAAALAAYSHFFHGSQVTWLAEVDDVRGVPVASLDERRRTVLLWEDGTRRPSGRVALHGLFLDVGRLERSDARLAGVDMTRILETLHEGRWPARDELFILADARADEYAPPAQPSLRDLALDPATWTGREVTVSGRFRGRNLFGEQPSSPGRSPHEYVLQVADASVWVSGLRPRGRGFTLDPDSRRDTREWLRFTGTVRSEGPLTWIEGRQVDTTRPPAETPPPPASPAVPPGPPPEILFSAPLDGETNVSRGVVLRVQFSRDIAPDSLDGQVAVAYAVGPDGTTPGAPPEARTVYRAANRSIEVRFAEPLAPGATVIVAFGNGITATDGVAMKPARIRFTTGR